MMTAEMNLFTSNSDETPPGAERDRKWRTFLLTMVAGFAALLPVTVLGLAVIDPYDNGKLAAFSKVGIVDGRPRVANASHGRDPAYNGAIYGNSHMQEIDPQRLTAETGVPFISMVAPGSWPREQLMLIDYFLRYHKYPRAIIVGIDDLWCHPDPALPSNQGYPIPYWLYGSSNLDYLIGLFRYSTLSHWRDRVRYLLGLRERSVPNGFNDYEHYYLSAGFAVPAARQKLLGQQLTAGNLNPEKRFPAAEALRSILLNLPDTTAVVLLRPPGYITALPDPNSPIAEADKACRERFQAIAQERKRTVLLDWRIDRPENRTIENYFDHLHYTRSLAAILETELARALQPIL
jgi:hypothetical protein